MSNIYSQSPFRCLVREKRSHHSWDDNPEPGSEVEGRLVPFVPEDMPPHNKKRVGGGPGCFFRRPTLVSL